MKRGERLCRLKNVKWYENKENDAKRRALREKNDHLATSPPPSVAGPSALSSRAAIQTGATRFQAALAPGEVTTCDGTDPNGRDLVFQHGFQSSAETWDQMSPWVRNDFVVGCALQFSLNAGDRYVNQADDLRGRIRTAQGDGSFLFIGHSNGGRISRYLGQQDYPGLVNGVVSIGSPHLGGPLARTGRNAIFAATSVMVYGLTSGCSGIVGITCTRPYFLASTIFPFLVGLGADEARPAFIDMRPGSDFENATNTTPESFPRVGIQSYSKRLFVEWRLYGDAKSGPDDIIDGGKYQVRAAWGAVVSNTACGAVGWMINRGDIAAHCGKRVVLLFAVTGLWNVLTSGLDRNDGIVPGRSQVWPFNPGSSGVYRNYGISDGDSHVGETRSTKVRERLREALRDDMKVQAKF